MNVSSTKDSPLERYMSALEALAPHSEGLTSQELELALGLPRTTVNRLVHLLSDAGLIVAANQRGRAYRLGPRILNLLHGAADGKWIENLTRIPLQDLAGATGQSAFISRLRDGKIRSVSCAAPDTMVRLYIEPETLLPANATATGKAIMAYLPPEELNHLLYDKLEAFTSRTKTDVEDLRNELAAVRENGYAIEVEEHVPGLASMACPILNEDGHSTYAVGLTGARDSVIGKTKSDNVLAMKRTAAHLTQLLRLPAT